MDAHARVTVLSECVPSGSCTVFCNDPELRAWVQTKADMFYSRNGIRTARKLESLFNYAEFHDFFAESGVGSDPCLTMDVWMCNLMDNYIIKEYKGFECEVCMYTHPTTSMSDAQEYSPVESQQESQVEVEDGPPAPVVAVESQDKSQLEIEDSPPAPVAPTLPTTMETQLPCSMVTAASSSSIEGGGPASSDNSHASNENSGRGLKRSMDHI